MENQPPPIYSPTPPLITAPRPPRRRSGWIWGLALILFLVVGAGILAIGGFALSFSSFGTETGPQSGRSMEEVYVERNGSKNKIAIVDVEGLITSQAWGRSGRNMVDLIEDQLTVAGRDEAVKAVILKVDSPGGEVLASDDISRAILQFQEKQKKPVIAAMGGLAASGGYYVSAPCQWIVANELTITGSIGVIMQSLNYRGLMDKVGLQTLIFKSGQFKDMLSGSKNPEDVDPREKEMIQNMVDETFGKFKKVVADGRKRAADINKGSGKTLAQGWEQLADGRILTGTQAFQNGFVDELGNFDTAVARARKIAGIADADLIRYQDQFHFLDSFSLFGKTESKSLKIDLGLEFPKLQAGRLYFLSHSFLH